MEEHKRAQLLHKDRQYVWHPFTQMKDYENQDHLLIEKAEGIHLYGADGRTYMDTVSSWWVNVHGHGHPRIKQAIQEQMERMDHVMFSGLTHEPAIVLAEKLVERTPEGLTRVFYSDNGSTAVEVALKMSYQYWQHQGHKTKHKFIYLQGSYHGDTLGAVSVGGVDLYHAIFKPLLFSAYQAPSPAISGMEQSLEAIEDLMKRHQSEIAGIVIEPLIQAAGGMHIYGADFLTRLRALCNTYEIHLIADEVATGFGRTGKMFACEYAGMTPDLICLSKGLTAGVMPLSATLCTEEIYQSFYDDYETLKTFFHGHSFTGNPLACAVGIESLNIFEDDNLLGHVQEVSAYMQQQFRRFADLEHVDHIRGLGMVAALNLVKDKDRQEAYDPVKRAGYQIYKQGLEEGLILRPLGDTIYYWLPLCTTKEQVDTIIARTSSVIEKVTAKL
ncbi:adenosylmethionine--8-amino-7-oxononanoate transaminase [Marinicrinis sediminis]|uniref:Adenosylmethionine-8-amino-7-oxononanoate aminotransferase n=1 Tax=Marinicrinis sediminis TaxID=1652465 RepID=A0ABW5RES9_9BACL